MRSLKKFIYEAVQTYDNNVPAQAQSFLDALTKDVDLSKLEETNDQDPNRFDISKANEQLFIDSFTKSYDDEYMALSTQDYYQLVNKDTKWENLSAKEKATFDTENGNIIIVDKNYKPVCFVDVEVSDKYLGAVSLGSLANFNEDGYYICICKKDGQVKFVSHKSLVEAVKANRDLLNPVMRGRYEGYPVKWEGEDLTSEYFVQGKEIAKFK